jgi:hypothetical protein
MAINPEPLTKVVWMERFAQRLMQLRPSMNSITAATHSVETYRVAQDANPEAEAEQLARVRYPQTS